MNRLCKQVFIDMKVKITHAAQAAQGSCVPGTPTPFSALAIRTVYQSPVVLALGVLPFVASNGTVIAASPTGMPTVSVSRVSGASGASRSASVESPKTTVFLRTNACPLSKWGSEAIVYIPNGVSAERVRESTRIAIREFRDALRLKVSTRKATS